MSDNRIKCVVIVTHNGAPRLIPVQVSCLDEERENGDHYEAAKDYVRQQYRLKGPYIVFDEDDAWFSSFEWHKTNTIDPLGTVIRVDDAHDYFSQR